MKITSLLSKLSPHKGFVYEQAVLRTDSTDGTDRIEVTIRPRRGSRAVCSVCQKPGPTYDTQQQPRLYQFVPMWGLFVFFAYCLRRVNCQHCKGVHVELVPWASGKERTTTALQLFLAHWAHFLSWAEVANQFKVSWNIVYRSIASVVSWGLEHRQLGDIRSIGVDELMIWKGHRYVTVVYQIDANLKRLLWVGKDRTAESFRGFFEEMGHAVCSGIQYVCSDMWKGYLQVVRERLPHAIHVLDRFHIVANLNRALDEVRATEARRLKANNDTTTLKNSRWCLLKRPKNLTRRQRGRLKELLQFNLKTVRAYLMANDFHYLWTYHSVTWAAKFLDGWCSMVMRSRIDPMKRIARQLRSHRELILNYFRAKKALNSGVVEAMNNNAKFTIRKGRGFRNFTTLKIALFHEHGNLPTPQMTHRFW